MDYFDKSLIDCISNSGFNPEMIYTLTKDDSIKRVEKGFCPICEHETIFVSPETWLRDHYICVRCHSLPRQRALTKVLSEVRPECRALKYMKAPRREVYFKNLNLNVQDIATLTIIKKEY